MTRSAAATGSVCSSCGWHAPTKQLIIVTFCSDWHQDVLCVRCWAMICTAATAALLLANDEPEST
jgi:hypothetical protein